MSINNTSRSSLNQSAISLGHRLEQPKSKGKIARYGWTLKGEPGTFEWIDKHLLIVDQEYQRPATTSKVTRITASFDWYAFGVLSVVVRRDESSNIRVMTGREITPEHRRRLSSGVSKLSETDVIDIRKRIARGETLASIGRIYGVHYTTITNIKAGRFYAGIGLEEGTS